MEDLNFYEMYSVVYNEKSTREEVKEFIIKHYNEKLVDKFSDEYVIRIG
jgi:hypothetical protein